MKLNRFALLVAVALVNKSLAVNGSQIFTPVVNEAGTLGLHSSSYGGSSKLGIGLNYNLAVDPSEVANEDSKMANYVHSLHFGVGSKISSRLHVFGDLSAHYIAPIGNALDAQIKTDNGNKFYIGNLKIGVGYAIVDNSEGGLGFGVIPHVVAPIGKLMGNKNHYLDGPRTGADRNLQDDMQYGGTVAVDYRILKGDYALFNLGYDHRANSNYLTWGFAYQKSLNDQGSRSIILELRGENNIDGAQAMQVENTDPVEADLAYRGYCHDNALAYTVGVGRGLNNQNGSPDLRVLVGVNWQLDHAKAAPVEKTPVEVKSAPKNTTSPVAAPSPEQKTVKTGKIYFANNKDEILEKSYPALDKLAVDLNANPSIKKLNVEGHTDNIGDAGYNKALSLKRAEAVKKYLLGRGVVDGILTTEGVGPDHPIEPNETSAGRAKNRRVEFRITEADGPVKLDLE